ncbi:MAG: hypothetical protein HUU34_08845 [Saprospiraceae bacterium]|nr:hypothetical protein [Saprospiraceae bacterium]
MKKLAFFFFSLLFVFTLYNFWQGAPPWYYDIETDMTSSTGCIAGTVSCQEFEASSIPDNINDKLNRPYHYVWFYSDGMFDSDYFTTSPGDNTLDAIHAFPSANDNNAILQLVPTYDDKDKPKHYNIGNTNFIPSDPTPITNGREIHLFHFLTPRRGDSLIYVLQYGNKYSPPTKGHIRIEFDKNAMRIDTIYTFKGEAKTDLLDSINTAGELEITYNELDSGSYRNIFIVLKFLENAPDSINTVSFPLELYAEKEGEEPYTKVDTLVLDFLASDAPHDPNYIIANKKGLCPDPIPDHLIYKIGFQNIGAGVCNKVTIKETLPINFLLDATGKDIVMLKPPGLNFDSINTKTREIVWTLTNNDFLKFDGSKAHLLQGTSGMTKGFTEEDTKDYILFRVTFDKNIPLIPCSAIPNRAEIIFEDLEPIVTNDYIATIKCTNCDSCTTTPGIEVLPAVKMKKGKTVTLQLPKNKTQFATHYTWYPPLGLDDPGSATPKATLNKNTVYTAIASGGCRQEIFKVPVMVTAKAKCACKGFWHCLWHCKWWLLFIILALIAWLLLRRRGGEA